MRSNHTQQWQCECTQRCLPKIKSPKLSRFNCKVTQIERERGKVCGCLLPGNIIKRAFNLIEFNPGGSSVPIVYNRTSICLMCHDIMAKVTRYFIASSSSSAVTKRAVNC